MKRSDYKRNTLLPNTGNDVPDTLRSFNDLLIPMTNTNHYRNSFAAQLCGIRFLSALNYRILPNSRAGREWEGLGARLLISQKWSPAISASKQSG